MKKPLILITNDDGIFAPGLKALVDVCAEIGRIVIVAPNSPQSGKGHAITLEDPLRINRVYPFGKEVEAYECDGTPADCVKLAKHVILENETPDICVSGINHGSNASINTIYSGTMSAAMEASLEGINSVGFSLLNYGFDADFSAAQFFVREIISYVLMKGLQNTKLLNVNIPYLPKEEIKGIKICRQAEATWVEKFQKGIDPRGQEYYWLTGEFINHDKGSDSDIWALENGYVSVVPTMHDLTAHEAVSTLKFLEE